MVEIVATGHRQNTGNKFADPDSRLTAIGASGATAGDDAKLRTESRWSHVGHLLVAIIRVPSLRPLPDRLALHGDRHLGTRPAGSRLIRPRTKNIITMAEASRGPPKIAAAHPPGHDSLALRVSSPMAVLDLHVYGSRPVS